MLPLWRDQVLIAISPTQFSMLRLRGWFGKYRVLAKHTQAIQVSKSNQSIWQPVLSELATVLEQPLWRKAKANVVLSNSLIRYSLLPWSEIALSADEEKRLAQFKIEEIFGVNAKGWEITLSDRQYGHARMVCAIDSEFMEGLRALAKHAQLNLLSVQPHLTAALNFWRKSLKAEQFHFVLADGEKICTAFIKKGNLAGLRIEQLSGTLSESHVASSLQRETLMNHEANTLNDAYLFVANKTNIQSDGNLPNKIQRLSLPASYDHLPTAFLAAAQLA